MVQRVVPRQGIFPEAEEELCTLPLVGVPVGHLGRDLDPLDQLLGRDSFFSFVAEEQWDVGCPSMSVVLLTLSWLRRAA